MDRFYEAMKGQAVDDLSKLRFPKLGSKKLDGIRCGMVKGAPHSFNMKPIRNLFIQAQLKGLRLLDGELIVGPPNAPDVYQRTNSGVMSIEGEPDFTYYVFDTPQVGYTMLDRIKLLKQIVEADRHPRVQIWPYTMLENVAAVESFEHMALRERYEGIMLSDPLGHYKFGKSTMREQARLKLKRELGKGGKAEEYFDGEAMVVGTAVQMHNANEGVVDVLGRLKRSSAKAGKVPAGVLGAIHVRGLNGPFADVFFDIGSGFTHEQRVLYWQDQLALVGKVVKYKCQMSGVKDLPRFPVFLGIRDPDDTPPWDE